MLFGPLLRKYINRSADRIKHWNPGKRTSADAAESAPTAGGGGIAPTSQSDTYQKRQYRLEVRRYIRERRESRRKQCLEIITLVVVSAYAGVTFWLAIIAREQLTYSERPWLGISSANFLEKAIPDKPIKIGVVVTNSGKSTALHVFERLIVKPLLYPLDDPKIPLTVDPALQPCTETMPKLTDDLGGGILLPGASSGPLEYKSNPAVGPTLTKLLAEPTVTETIPNTELTSIERIGTVGSKTAFGLFLIGCIDYFDEFKKPHRTHVCSMYYPSETAQNGAVFANCPKGNSAD